MNVTGSKKSTGAILTRKTLFIIVLQITHYYSSYFILIYISMEVNPNLTLMRYILTEHTIKMTMICSHFVTSFRTFLLYIYKHYILGFVLQISKVFKLYI